MASRFSTDKLIKPVKFMGEDVNIRKLTVGQVIEIQNKAKALIPDITAEELAAGAKVPDNTDANIDLLTYVIKSGAAEFADYTAEDFRALPMDELGKLSGEIMKYSGLTK